MVTTPANVHDVTKADELRRPDDWEVIGDSGYLGMEKRESADPERVTYTAAKRYGQRKKLSAERVADEKVLSSIRCKVEHAFHRIKVQFGYRKVRYRGQKRIFQAFAPVRTPFARVREFKKYKDSTAFFVNSIKRLPMVNNF